MDLPFLFVRMYMLVVHIYRFNPYSNGSSFFIKMRFWLMIIQNCVSILILMDLPFLCGIMGKIKYTATFVSILILMDLPFL